jgi:hypothetical protein
MAINSGFDQSANASISVFIGRKGDPAQEIQPAEP